ncbi:MAG: CBS domain-containing protein [Planctomycetes bacterium]|nr:CBS domain-containing protein [Planctomycetota bacterium]
MNISEVMSHPAACCGPFEPLSEAARIMWDKDCGVVPIVEPMTNALLGVVTDRDLCMASYTQGRKLSEIPIESIMVTQVVTCRASESTERAHERLRQNGLRRLIVVDDHGAVEGIVSLNDLARAAARAAGADQGALQKAVATTLAEVSRSHAERDAAKAQAKAHAEKAAAKPMELKPAPKAAAPAPAPASTPAPQTAKSNGSKGKKSGKG